MNKKISIIIPVYNVEKYIERCLESILKNKKIEECEIILVDDGSTDNSSFICKEYVKNNRNIYYYYKENGGASDARNYGIWKACGDFLWFIDSDDSIEENAVDEFIRIIDYKKNDVIICQSKIVEPNNEIYDECVYTIKKGLYTSEEFMKVLKKNPRSVMFSPQYYLVRREFILKNKIFFLKGIIYEDELWIPQLLLKAEGIYYSACNIYYHYMINTSVMHSTKLEKMGKSDLIVAKELFKIYDESKRNDLEFLRDKCANIFLQSVWKISSFLENKDNIMRYIPIKNAYYIKTKLKCILYCISPRLYIWVHNIFCKGENK